MNCKYRPLFKCLWTWVILVNFALSELIESGYITINASVNSMLYISVCFFSCSWLLKCSASHVESTKSKISVENNSLGRIKRMSRDSKELLVTLNIFVRHIESLIIGRTTIKPDYVMNSSKRFSLFCHWVVSLLISHQEEKFYHNVVTILLSSISLFMIKVIYLGWEFLVSIPLSSHNKKNRCFFRLNFPLSFVVMAIGLLLPFRFMWP